MSAFDIYEESCVKILRNCAVVTPISRFISQVDNFIDVSDDNDDDDFGDDGDDDNDDHYDPSGTYHHSHHSKDCEGNRANDFAVDSSASFRCASNFQLQSSNEIYQEKNLRCAGSAFDCEGNFQSIQLRTFKGCEA